MSLVSQSEPLSTNGYLKKKLLGTNGCNSTSQAYIDATLHINFFKKVEIGVFGGFVKYR